MPLVVTILVITHIIVGVLAFCGGRAYETRKQLNELMSHERNYPWLKK